MTNNSAPAQFCSICEGVGFYVLDVPPGHPRFGKAIECQCHRTARLAAEQAAMLARSGCYPAALAAYTFERFDPAQAVGGKPAQLSAAAIKDVCVAYAADPQGWLVLIGGTGAGKTHLAYAIAKTAIEHGMATLWATVPDLLDSLRASYEDHAYEDSMKALETVPLVVLDDLGTEHATSWAVEKLFQIINGRYNRRLPLVVTTNVELTSARLDGRIRSRLMDTQLARTLVLPCGDYRVRAKGWANGT